MARFRQVLAATIIAAVAVVGFGCAGDYLREDDLYEDDPAFQIDEKAEIPNTPEYRRVLDVLAHYRRAVVDKDIGTLRRLASESYYENAGTTDTTRDDYSADQLGAVFDLISNASDIQFEVTVEDVELDEDGQHASFDFAYEFAYKYEVGGDSAWDADRDVNRLELLHEGGHWRIVSGM